MYQHSMHKCFVILTPWIWKPSYGGSSFSTRSYWFNISSSVNAQEAGRYIWRPPFIWCHWPPSLCKICAYTLSDDVQPAGWTWVRKNSILTHRKASLHSGRFGGDVLSDLRIGVDMPKTVPDGLTWGCGIIENTLTKLVCAFIILYTIMCPSWGVQL